MAHIYLDKQTQNLIEGLRKENPQFNLSAFVKKILLDYQNEDTDNLEAVKHEITQLELENKKVLDKIEFLKEKELKIMAKEEHNKHTKAVLTDELMLKLLKWYDLNEITAEMLADKYDRSKHGSITKYMSDQGYSIKEEEIQNI